MKKIIKHILIFAVTFLSGAGLIGFSHLDEANWAFLVLFFGSILIMIILGDLWKK